jgi:hypothetical protein
VVPWKELTLANDKYLLKGSLPENTNLCDPSKLQQFAVINLWNFWMRKQRQGGPGLTFIHAKHEDRRARDKGKKRTVEFVDPSMSPPPTKAQRSISPTNTSRSPSPASLYELIHTAGLEERVPPHIGQNEHQAGPSRMADHQPIPAERVQSDTSQGPSLTDQQPPDTDNHNHDEDDKEADMDPDSPKAHMQTKKGRFQFLKSLSQDEIYRAMLRSMERIKVSNLIIQFEELG